MMAKQIMGLWQFECDAVLTRSLFAAAAEVGARCDCAPCRNFRALGPHAFSAPARAILEALGIDPTQASELYPTGVSQAGIVPHAGFFHFVGGSLEGDRESSTEADGFRYFITTHAARVSKTFAPHPVLQLEFETSLPWVLDEPCL